MVNSKEDLRKFAEIFVDSSEVESMLEYILDKLKIEYKSSSFQDKIHKFCKYIDSRSVGKKSVDKIFLSKYSLLDVFSNIKKYSDIARHEANYLLSGLSKVHIKARKGKFKKQYNGDLNKLYREFKRSSKALFSLYEMIQVIGDYKFERFDIDGSEL